MLLLGVLVGTTLIVVPKRGEHFADVAAGGWGSADVEVFGDPDGALMGLEVAAGVAGERSGEALRLWAAGGA